MIAPQFVVPAVLTWQLGGVPQTPAVQFGVAAGQATALPHPVHPFDCIAQVSTPPGTHWFAPTVQALVQQAPSLQAPFVHGADSDSYTHPCGSSTQVARVDVVAHTFPTAAHVGSALHVHEAVPEGPVQLWCAPGHAIAIPHCPSAPHVWMPVPEQLVAIGVQTLAEMVLVEIPVLASSVLELLDAELAVAELAAAELMKPVDVLDAAAAEASAKLPDVALLETATRELDADPVGPTPESIFSSPGTYVGNDAVGIAVSPHIPLKLG
jgi:hypothetical protein